MLRKIAYWVGLMQFNMDPLFGMRRKVTSQLKALLLVSNSIP